MTQDGRHSCNLGPPVFPERCWTTVQLFTQSQPKVTQRFIMLQNFATQSWSRSYQQMAQMFTLVYRIVVLHSITLVTSSRLVCFGTSNPKEGLLNRGQYLYNYTIDYYNFQTIQQRILYLIFLLFIIIVIERSSSIELLHTNINPYYLRVTILYSSQKEPKLIYL